METNKYTSHAFKLLRSLVCNLQTSKYTIIVDETIDISTIEQVMIMLRWVDSSLKILLACTLLTPLLLEMIIFLDLV